MDALVDIARDALSSPWGYVALFVFAFWDAFIPMVPSETLVVTAGVFAASEGEPNLLLAVVVAALGAIVGDHVSYFIGRGFGPRVLAWMRRRRRGGAAADWAERSVRRRGGTILIVARYIPGGRTAVTMTMGAAHVPLRTFTAYDVIAASAWAIYCAAVGYLGGSAFEDDPLLGTALGVTLAMGVAGVVELARHRRTATSEA